MKAWGSESPLERELGLQVPHRVKLHAEQPCWVWRHQGIIRKSLCVVTRRAGLSRSSTAALHAPVSLGAFHCTVHMLVIIHRLLSEIK